MKRRKWRRAHFAVACGVAFIWLALFGNAAQADSQSGDAARGKQLYYAHGCYECHGFNGETGARNLVGTGSPIVQDRDTFIAFLRLRANVAPMVPSAPGTSSSTAPSACSGWRSAAHSSCRRPETRAEPRGALCF